LSQSARKQEAARKNVAKALAVRLNNLPPKKSAPPKKDRTTVWGKADTLAFMVAHPDNPITARMVVASAPKQKQASALNMVGQHLNLLLREGEIGQLSRGTYLYAPWRKKPEMASQKQVAKK
jgi:hypothetical protein